MAQAQTHLAFQCLPSFPFLSFFLSVCLPFCLLDDTVRLLAFAHQHGLLLREQHRRQPRTAIEIRQAQLQTERILLILLRPSETKTETQRNDRTGQDRTEQSRAKGLVQ